MKKEQEQTFSFPSNFLIYKGTIEEGKIGGYVPQGYCAICVISGVNKNTYKFYDENEKITDALPLGAGRNITVYFISKQGVTLTDEVSSVEWKYGIPLGDSQSITAKLWLNIEKIKNECEGFITFVDKNLNILSQEEKLKEYIKKRIITNKNNLNLFNQQSIKITIDDYLEGEILMECGEMIKNTGRKNIEIMTSIERQLEIKKELNKTIIDNLQLLKNICENIVANPNYEVIQRAMTILSSLADGLKKANDLLLGRGEEMKIKQLGFDSSFLPQNFNINLQPQSKEVATDNTENEIVPLSQGGYEIRIMEKEKEINIRAKDDKTFEKIMEIIIKNIKSSDKE